MYELIILSLLMRFPLHGYLIAHIANDVIGPWARLSNGTLYPLLTRLEQSGLIVRATDTSVDAPDARTTRTFTISDTGRRRFRELMLDTSAAGDYQRLFHLKVPYLDLLAPRERLHLLNHYLSYCQTCVLHNTTHAENLALELGEIDQSSPLYQDLALEVMRHRASLWQAEAAWTEILRARLVTDEKAPTSPT
jgi:DNA-binding PadR family transcriptional regulator